MKEKVVEIIESILKSDNRPLPSEINLDSNLRDDFALDSLDLAELTVRIEDEFGIDIFEDGLVSTLGEILEKLEK